MVAQVISYDELDWWDIFKRFARGRFIPRKVNDLGVAEYSRSPQELINLLRTH